MTGRKLLALALALVLLTVSFVSDAGNIPAANTASAAPLAQWNYRYYWLVPYESPTFTTRVWLSNTTSPTTAYIDIDYYSRCGEVFLYGEYTLNPYEGYARYVNYTCDRGGFWRALVMVYWQAGSPEPTVTFTNPGFCRDWYCP